MSWALIITPQPSPAPLTPEQLAAGMEPHSVQPSMVAIDPRPWIAARTATCRPCPHVGHWGQTCAACDLRCAHPDAQPGRQLLAVPESTCPDNRWPTTP